MSSGSGESLVGSDIFWWVLVDSGGFWCGSHGFWWVLWLGSDVFTAEVLWFSWFVAWFLLGSGEVLMGSAGSWWVVLGYGGFQVGSGGF